MHPLSLLHGHHYIQDRLTTVRGDVSGPGISSRKRLNQVCPHNAFGTRYKESPRSVQFVESREVDVGFVNGIKSAGLDVALLAEQVEYFDVADINETWNGALQIYCRRIECVHLSAHQRVQFRVRRLVGVKFSRRFDQMMSQVCKNLPRHEATCVGQRVARNRLAAQTHMIKMFALSSQI